MSAASKDIERTEKKTDDGRPQRSNSRSSEAMSKRSNKAGGFGTDRYVQHLRRRLIILLLTIRRLTIQIEKCKKDDHHSYSSV